MISKLYDFTKEIKVAYKITNKEFVYFYKKDRSLTITKFY